MTKQTFDEQAEIARWLWRQGGPTKRPDWGALQPLYDRAVLRGHRLVRLIPSNDQPCSFELDHEPIGDDALILFAKAALCLDLDPTLLKAAAVKTKKRSLRRNAAAAPEMAAPPVEPWRLSRAELQNVIDVGPGLFERTLLRSDDDDPVRAFA